MPLAEPAWWYDTAGRWEAVLLAPVAAAYGAVATARVQFARPAVAANPVICVGNLTVGGTGKTPLVREIAARLTALGRRPVVLSRGYGGRERGPLVVVPGQHTSRDVGDEPLLLARDGPVVVSRRRPAGATLIADRFGPQAVIVMDDGLQNPSLAKDLVIAVVAAGRKFGNGRVFPAGPLRAPLAFQLGLVDALLVNRAVGVTMDDTWTGGVDGKPVLRATTEPAGDVAWLAGTKVVAYAGIGDPDRFFRLLRGLGADVVAARRFGDHHDFNTTDADDLFAAAAASGATLVTTSKDIARMTGVDGAVGRLATRSRVLDITLRLAGSDSETLDALLALALDRFALRS